MVTLDELCELEGDFDALDDELFTTGSGLHDLTEICIDPNQAQRLRLGNPVILRGRDAPAFAEDAFATIGDELIAIGEVEKGYFKPRRVFSHSRV